jgi:hypothetical protein
LTVSIILISKYYITNFQITQVIFFPGVVNKSWNGVENRKKLKNGRNLC